MAGREEARLARAELAMFQAYHTAAFMRSKKLPRHPPTRRKSKATPTKPQSGTDVVGVMRALMAMTNKGDR